MCFQQYQVFCEIAGDPLSSSKCGSLSVILEEAGKQEKTCGITSVQHLIQSSFLIGKMEDLCNGCGICEYVCPLEEKAGIEVFKRTKRKI
jgi:NAD-dependent dihydropyrimidine dehydrogenase PreA subunit